MNDALPLPPARTWEARLRQFGATEPGQPPSRRAAVAVILRLAAAAPSVLLMTRVEQEADPWSGQVSFPGGMHCHSDTDLLATAVRETREEVGLDLSRSARLLCRLAALPAVARSKILAMDITPFVFDLGDEAGLAPGEEARDVFWLPLDRAASGEFDARHHYHHDGTTRDLPCWRYEGRTIWGLTYRMLKNLLSVVTAST